MPVVTITLIEGYDEETRRTLSRRLTDAVCATIAAPLDGITVIVNEVAAAGYMRGRQARVPGAPLPGAAELVRAYLDAVEAGEFDAARAMLAEGFTMVFPGDVEMRTPEELAAWSKGRYRNAHKTYDRIDEGAGEDGVAVYAFGTLSGAWPDGTTFDGVRFIDRFTVADGKIVDQRVWNDLAEAAVRAGRSLWPDASARGPRAAKADAGARA